MKNMMKKQKGQGVVEYAGALVIAASVVALVVAAGPTGIETLFNDVLSYISDTFTGFMSQV